jgi:hypothetical protein
MEEHWYAARDKNRNEFKLHLTDAHSALNLQNSGWELGERPFDKKENAKSTYKSGRNVFVMILFREFRLQATDPKDIAISQLWSWNNETK